MCDVKSPTNYAICKKIKRISRKLSKNPYPTKQFEQIEIIKKS